jgi:hypothetical protein
MKQKRSKQMQVPTIRHKKRITTRMCKVKKQQRNEGATFKTKKCDEHNTHNDDQC